ncbi:hypothetical protein [Actinoplanes palleronii]|uniref:Uncharacterized protein n=1 Tax=Actinoplanes palleronii TaxID=113570 RepID=A0ABQ4B6N4_9ACTN|nr:hypothetical protein [Actinoplanes palleronii]GIE66291.1 hypothetical protein Apa02nite_023990 [Actinoplanes palleronii]
MTPAAVVTTTGLAGKTTTTVTAGSAYACALESQRMFCWGSNQYGQLGDGTTAGRNTPADVSTAATLLGAKTVATLTAAHVLLMRADHRQRRVLLGQQQRRQLVAATGDVTGRTSPNPIQMTGILYRRTVSVLDAGNGTTSIVAS